MLATIAPITLRGDVVRLEPLQIEHTEALARVGLEPGLWRLQPRDIRTLEDMRHYVESALEDQRIGSALPFVIVHHATGEIIGTTRFMDIAPAHRRLEIGATWLTPQHQRTKANTEAKFLLLTHAFEELGTIRVVLKTESLNTQSRAAIERIGAQFEGIFRKHFIADSGRLRDMAYYAILDEDWPRVKAALAEKLKD